jgi:hypothetical protein
MQLRVTSSFRREVDEKYALLGHYAASSDKSLPTFRDNLSVTSSRVLPNRLSRNVGGELPLLAA